VARRVQFRKAEQGDEHQRTVQHRFGRLMGARRDHNSIRSIVNDSLVRPLLLPLIYVTISSTVLATPSPQQSHILNLLH